MCYNERMSELKSSRELGGNDEYPKNTDTHNSGGISRRQLFGWGVLTTALFTAGSLIGGSVARSFNPHEGIMGRDNDRRHENELPPVDQLSVWIRELAAQHPEGGKQVVDQEYVRRSINQELPGMYLAERASLEIQLSAKGNSRPGERLSPESLARGVVGDEINSILNAISVDGSPNNIDMPHARLTALMAFLMVNQDILMDDKRELRRLLDNYIDLSAEDLEKTKVVLDEAVGYLAPSYHNSSLAHRSVASFARR